MNSWELALKGPTSAHTKGPRYEVKAPMATDAERASPPVGFKATGQFRLPRPASVSTPISFFTYVPITSISFRELISRVEDLRTLPHSGAGAPSPAARAVAAALLMRSNAVGIVPDRVAATADGGVMLYFFARPNIPGRYASFECHENGEIVLLLSDRSAGTPPEVADVDFDSAAMADTLRKIGAFLGRECLAQ